MVETPEGATFGEFLKEHPELQDTKLLDKHYSAELLQTAKAREGWVAPDLEPLPQPRIYRCC